MKLFRFHYWHGAVFILAGLYFIIASQIFLYPLSTLKQGINSAISSIRLFYQDTWRVFGSPLASEDIETIRNERNAYARMVGEQNILKQENSQLKELLAFKQRSQSILLGARIVGRSADISRSMLIIDRGSSDGVIKDLPVVAENGVLLGKIAKVQHETSFVRLLNDPKSKIVAAYKMKDADVEGLVSGKFHTGIELHLVPITEPIEKGAPLYTTGTQENIPAGLLVGFISEFNSAPTDLFYSIKIKPAVLAFDITAAGVLIPQKKDNDN